MHGLNFGVGIGIGVIIGLLISLMLDRWHEWKDEMNNENSVCGSYLGWIVHGIGSRNLMSRVKLLIQQTLNKVLEPNK